MRRRIVAVGSAVMVVLAVTTAETGTDRLSPSTQVIEARAPLAVLELFPSTTNTTTTTTVVIPSTTTTTTLPTRVSHHVPQEAALVVRSEALGEIEGLVYAAFGEHGAEAVRVARCESGLNPQARNGSHVGLFQISVRWHAERIEALGFSVEGLTDPSVNLAVALDIFSESGWGPWSCRP